MNLEKEQIFSISKTKIALLLLGQLAFIGVFYFIVFVSPSNYALGPARLLGIVLLALFILLLPFTPIQLFDKSPGLIIGPHGIVVKRAGKIAWHQVKRIHVSKTFRSGNFLSLELYDDTHKVQIPARFLEISFDETVTLVKAYYKKYGHS